MFHIVGSGGEIVAGLPLFTSVSAYHSPWYRLNFCFCSPSCGTTVRLGVGLIKQFPAFLYSKNVGMGGIVFKYLLIIALIILIIHLCILIYSSVCLSEHTSSFYVHNQGVGGARNKQWEQLHKLVTQAAHHCCCLSWLYISSLHLSVILYLLSYYEVAQLCWYPSHTPGMASSKCNSV